MSCLKDKHKTLSVQGRKRHRNGEFLSILMLTIQCQKVESLSVFSSCLTRQHTQPSGFLAPSVSVHELSCSCVCSSAVCSQDICSVLVVCSRIKFVSVQKIKIKIVVLIQYRKPDDFRGPRFYSLVLQEAVRIIIQNFENFILTIPLIWKQF